jgi:serine/threonine-protein phosphatase 2A regulatory subunit B
LPGRESRRRRRWRRVQVPHRVSEPRAGGAHCRTAARRRRCALRLALPLTRARITLCVTLCVALQFDYLKSLEIEEKINKIRWCQQGANAARFLLSTNDKTIKLWKVSEKRVKNLVNFNCAAEERTGSGALAGPSAQGSAPPSPLEAGPGRVRPVFASAGALRVPQVASSEAVLTARCRRAYPNAHAYHINSISVNSDCATFISADDLRINLWSLDAAAASSFTIVDIKPENMENLTEVITAAVFHPQNCALFAYSSSKGCIRLADMRARALCESHAKLFEEAELPGTRSFFSEIIASISDVQFGAGGRYLLARDYLTLKVWDVAMEARPLATFSVHEALRSKLCDLYENDAIFDKFECAMSGDGANAATGTYSNLFRVFATHGEGDASVEASKDPQRTGDASGDADHKLGARASVLSRPRGGRAGRLDGGSELPAGGADYGAKLLHLAWHPQRDVIAAAAGNSLYIMHAPPPQPPG